MPTVIVAEADRKLRDIDLSLAKPFPPSALLESEAAHRSKETTQISVGSRGRGILVVDDEPAIRNLLQIFFRLEGFLVWTAASGEEALDHCCENSEKIALVLLDVQMPGLDGPETLDGIRELEADIPVCFMTGYPAKHDPADLLRRGARHLFNKPFRLEEMIRVVRRLANEPMRHLQKNRQQGHATRSCPTSSPFGKEQEAVVTSEETQ